MPILYRYFYSIIVNTNFRHTKEVDLWAKKRKTKNRKKRSPTEPMPEKIEMLSSVKARESQAEKVRF